MDREQWRKIGDALDAVEAAEALDPQKITQFNVTSERGKGGGAPFNITVKAGDPLWETLLAAASSEVAAKTAAADADLQTAISKDKVT